MQLNIQSTVTISEKKSLINSIRSDQKLHEPEHQESLLHMGCPELYSTGMVFPVLHNSLSILHLVTKTDMGTTIIISPFFSVSLPHVNPG
jgi:hypothetical protein